MKRQIMKMKYITPAITIMETVMETNLLDGSTQGSGSTVLGPSGPTDPSETPIPGSSEDVDMGSKGYNAWEAWDEF